MVLKCEIKFDNNPNGIYFAGQTLSGIVELTVDKPKKIRGLILKIEGFAKVQWSETEHRKHHNNHHNVHNHGHDHHGSTSTHKTVEYSGREDYLNTISYLIGSPEGNQIEIAAGSYQFNFQAILPPLLPTSFEAKHGSIRYLINVVIDRPWKFDLTYKVAFTVLKQLDLNYENPALRIPTKMEILKTFYCGLCKTAPLYVAASIPMSGYVAGQNVTVSIEINNESSIDVDDIKVTLKKLIFYNSQTPIKKTKEEVLTEIEIRSGGVLKRSKGKFDQKLLIPPVPPSNMNYCRVLNVSYEIHVTAKISGIHTNPVIRLPITIGTVPLNVPIPQNQQFVIQYPTAPSQTPSPNGHIPLTELVNPPQNMQQNFGDLPPPSYHEAIGSAIQLNEEGEHSMGVQPFHPMYPVYNFNNNQQTTAPSTPTPQSSHPYGFTAEASSGQPSAPGSISDSAIIQKY